MENKGKVKPKYPKGYVIAEKVINYLLEEQYGELLGLPRQELNKIIEACKILKK